MYTINKISTLMLYADLLPKNIMDDIGQRITDWVDSGGTLEDSYVKQQYKYAEKVLNQNLKQKPFIVLGYGVQDFNDSIASKAECPNCGVEHDVGYGEEVLADGTRIPSKLLAYVHCTENGADYLVGICGTQVKPTKN